MVEPSAAPAAIALGEPLAELRGTAASLPSVYQPIMAGGILSNVETNTLLFEREVSVR